jgi:hypothetical protein
MVYRDCGGSLALFCNLQAENVRLVINQGITMRKVLVFVAALFLASISIGSKAQEVTQQIDVDITRYLDAINYVNAFKHGIQVQIARSGQTTDQLQSILNAPEEDILRVIVPILRPQFTADEAHAIAEFYCSETGRTITRWQMVNVDDLDPPIYLTTAQKEEYGRFARSKDMEIVLQVKDFMDTVSYQKALGLALRAKFQ